MRPANTILLGLIAWAACLFAETPDKPVWEISGWGWMTQGQVVRSAYYDPFEPDYFTDPPDTLPGPGQSLYGANYYLYDFSHAWLNDIDVGIRATCQMTPRTRMCVNLGLDMRFNTVTKKHGSVEQVNSFAKTVRPVILESSVSTEWVNKGWLKLDSKAGYFSYKYNPEARNLGEYLFRSQPYPNILVSGFEIADKAKVMGFKGHAALWDRLDQEIFLASESETYPAYDFSLSYLVRARPTGCLDLGAGVSFSRLFPVNKYRTTPGLDDKAFTAPSDRLFARYADTLTGDTTLYTFQGTKLMARLTFDPKKLVPMPLLGNEDLKLYGEIALLGTKNYPVFYEKRSERRPVMAGINLPAFKLLDVLAAEFEWYDNPYPNSARFIWEKRSPLPFTGLATPGYSTEENIYDLKHKDDFKWSVYASRRLNKLLRLSLQVANDHSQRDDYAVGLPAKIYQEICQDPKDLYWITRLTFGM